MVKVFQPGALWMSSLAFLVMLGFMDRSICWSLRKRLRLQRCCSEGDWQRQACARQGLVSAIWPGLDLSLPSKGPEISEADGKLWWRLTTGQEHWLHLSTTPTYHGNGPADAWKAVQNPVCPRFPLLFFVWYHSLWALTWADVVCLSFRQDLLKFGCSSI